jgi:molecular chaperone DnaK
MRDEAKANEAKDKEERERVDKLNSADTMIFSTEKQLGEYGDKLPADKKGRIETALGNLKEAHKAQNLADIDRFTEELNAAWQEASQDMYAQSAQGQPQSDPGAGGSSANNATNPDEVTDVDFEEVK